MVYRSSRGLVALQAATQQNPNRGRPGGPRSGTLATTTPTTLRPQQGDHLEPAQILANARALRPTLASRSAEIEELRRLPADLVEQLLKAGFFRMNMPGEWGGPEMTSMQQVEVIEEVSRGDASVGWCIMIGCDAGLYSSWLEDEVARVMYPRLDMVQAGWVYPMGRADRTADGYLVNGDWLFGSGCTHCDWLAAGVVVHENDKPVISENGMPEWRIVLAPRDEYEILDTWYTTGLRGTGSNDYRCCDLLVPSERSFSFMEPARREGTLYRSNETFLRKMSGVPLGLGRAAIDHVSESVQGRVAFPSGVAYRDVPRVQAAVARAEMKLGAARSWVYGSLAELWDVYERGDQPSVAQRSAVWLSRLNAFQSARDCTRLMYDTLGGGAVYTKRSPLDRALRDAESACQHLMGQTKSLEDAGALLLGSEATMQHPML
ncbi:MAG: acyl-CoA dehydrogenase family protein [Proteobacteria bacterium]|nr:acyl-CoA dehydrogenase family protein [Pseudomonadota bacterium]